MTAEHSQIIGLVFLPLFKLYVDLSCGHTLLGDAFCGRVPWCYWTPQYNDDDNDEENGYC